MVVIVCQYEWFLERFLVSLVSRAFVCIELEAIALSTRFSDRRLDGHVFNLSITLFDSGSLLRSGDADPIDSLTKGWPNPFPRRPRRRQRNWNPPPIPVNFAHPFGILLLAALPLEIDSRDYNLWQIQCVILDTLAVYI